MINMIGIVPQNHLYSIRNDAMHLVLAQLFNEPGYETYTHFFMNEIKNYAYVILDNGAAEGNLMDIDRIVAKAELLRPSEIVLPDAYKDSENTLRLHADAIEYLIGYYGGADNIPFKLMCVPQGKTEDEWLACAKALLNKYGEIIDTIGIPKHLIDTLGNRDARLNVIVKLNEDPEIDLSEYDIHLLGCWKTPLEVLTVAKVAEQGDIPMVRSCDSAIAYVYARNGKRFEDDDRPDYAAIDFRTESCDSTQLEINLQDWRNIGKLITNNITYM